LFWPVHSKTDSVADLASAACFHLHCLHRGFGFAVGRGDAAAVEVVAANDAVADGDDGIDQPGGCGDAVLACEVQEGMRRAGRGGLPLFAQDDVRAKVAQQRLDRPHRPFQTMQFNGHFAQPAFAGQPTPAPIDPAHKIDSCGIFDLGILEVGFDTLWFADHDRHVGSVMDFVRMYA